MGTKIPLQSIPDALTAPQGIYELEVTALTQGQTSNDSGNKLMVTVDVAIVDPPEHNDVSFREWFALGSDDDPDCTDPAGKWLNTPGSRSFKKLLIACGYPLAELDLDDIEVQLPTCRFIGSVDLRPARKDAKSGKDYGESNRVGKFFAPGTQSVNGPAPAPTQPAATRAPAPVRAPAPAPSARPSPARPAARPAAQAAPRPGPARPAPRQAATAPADAAPEEAVAETRAIPAATFTTRAHRSPAKARAGTGAPLKAAERTQECAICLDVVPRAEFQAHVKAHGDAA